MRLVAERFTFFGQDLVLVSDTPEVIASLAAVYERHVARNGLMPAGRPRMQVRVMGDPRAGGPSIEFEGRRIRVPARAQLEHFAHLVMINAAAAVAGDRVVLHAGAVARSGHATLIVGPSGWGKTSLTLELVRRGWSFLSDDFAPIDATGTVEPFPRRVSLTDPSLAMLGVPLPPSALALASVGGGRKWMADIEDVLGACLAPPARISTIFVMAARHVSATGLERVRVSLSNLSDGLAHDIESLAGVRRLERVSAAALPVVDLYLSPGTRITAALDAACQVHDTAILAADNAPWSAATFDRAPQAMALGLAEGVAALMAHAVTVSARRFLRTAGQDDFGAEAALLRGAVTATNARLFLLEPGPLGPTADLVDQLSP